MNMRTYLGVFGAIVTGTVTHGSAALACSGGRWDQEPSIGAINDSSIGTLSVSLNPGVGVFSSEAWPADSRKALFGNLDGKPGSEAISINEHSITVKTWNLPADGTAPSYNDATVWNHGAFYGNVDTMVADMDNDGLDDIVAWNANNIAFVRSTGSGFESVKFAAWGPSDYYGTVASLVADMNGDNFPDLVAWNPASIGVSYFLPAAGVWGAVQVFNISMRGDAANYSGDVNGDGRTDLISIRALRHLKDRGEIGVRHGRAGGGFGNLQVIGERGQKGAIAYFAMPSPLSATHDLYEVWGSQQRVWWSGSGPHVLTTTPFFGTRFTGPAFTPVWRVNIC